MLMEECHVNGMIGGLVAGHCHRIYLEKSHAPYFEERIRGTTEISAGLIAAQAVSSLQIRKMHAESILINRMLRRVLSLDVGFYWSLQ
ncbi:hypothetical protein IFM89_023729 [Coptis chinensis]|uniref:Uncharacterized protein n=1 Tax=Coptis chinensis TaxID=261450 RepID=A0A835IDB5_9MAGN|nr:hypothetical protein IFM89_023729 [Coptis chinensis]